MKINLKTVFRFLFILVVALLVTLSAFASGFALIESSVGGLGNSYAGAAATADDAGTSWWNPAGMTRLQHPTASIALHGITPATKFHNSNSKPACIAPEVCRSLGNNGGDIGYIEYVPATFIVVPLTKDLAVGVSVTVPFGMRNDYAYSWAGRYQAITSEVSTGNINPSIAFKVTEFFSVGAGISYQMLDAKLVSAVSPTAIIGFAAQSGDIPPALVPHAVGESLGVPDIIETLKGSGHSYGYNLGVLLTLSPATRLGLHYRSAMAYSLKGDATFTAPTIPVTSQGTGVIVQTLTGLQQTGQYLASGRIHGSLRTPDSFSVSVASWVTPTVQLLADVTYTGWHSIPKLEFLRDDGTVLTSVEYNWKDTARYALGANYKVNDTLTLRGGVSYDETPMDTGHRTPYAPDADRVGFSIGGSYKLSPSAILDIGYSRTFLKDPRIDHRSDGYPEFYGVLDGNYSTNISTISAGVSYTFK